MTISELAERILNVSDQYEVMDQYGTEENALNAIETEIERDPIGIIAYLLEMIEELQA